jgi:hypothetical protein
MYVNVCYVRCCSQNSKILCAVNKTYCFSLVLPGNEMVNVWCCNPMSNIFGAVKKTSFFEFGAINELYNLIWCYGKNLIL